MFVFTRYPNTSKLATKMEMTRTNELDACEQCLCAFSNDKSRQNFALKRIESALGVQASWTARLGMFYCSP
jgi:hypothetical protein